MCWLLISCALAAGQPGPLNDLPAHLVPKSQEVSKHKEQKTAETNNQPKAEERGTEALPLAVTSPKKTDIESKAEETERHNKTWNENWLTYSTIWLAGVTTLLALFTFWLWSATRKLVIGAEDTAKRQLRAYISVHGSGISGVEIGHTPVAKIAIKNSGQTPAYDVKVQIALTAVATASDLAAALRKNKAPIVGPVQIGPSGKISPSSIMGSAITTAALESLMNHTYTLFVHGRVDYTDIFKRSHWLTFRLFQDGKGVPIGSDRLLICDEGNDADRD